MNAEVSDRLVDHALRELYRGLETPDLAPAIAERLARGETGSGLADLQPRDGPDGPEAPRAQAAGTGPSAERRRGRRLRALAATALVVAGLGAATWRLLVPAGERGGSATTDLVARAEPPVALLRGAERARTVDAELRAGDVLWPEAPTRVELADGTGALTADAGAVLELGRGEPGAGTRIGLLRGTLGLERFAAGGQVDAGLARLELEGTAPAALTCTLSFATDTPLARGAADPIALARLASPVGLPRVLEIEVEDGEVAVRHRGGREVLVAGSRRELWSVAELDAVATPEGKREVLERVERMLEGYRPEPWNDGWSDEARLAELLTEDRGYWAVVRAELVRRVASFQLGEEGMGRLLDFLLSEPSGTGFALARDELWLLFPEGFSDFHVAALAERGAFEFQREASAQVAAVPPDAKAGEAPVWSAIWLARRGDHEALAWLRERTELHPEPAGPFDMLGFLLGADALRRAGDAETWHRALDEVVAATRARLERGGILMPAYAVVALETVLGQRDRAHPVPLGSLTSFGARLAARMPDLGDREGIELALRLALEGR